MTSGFRSIILGSDHAGFELKEYIGRTLEKHGKFFFDSGVHSAESSDYPDIAFNAALAVSQNKYDCGILICGTGIGMSITANKVQGIRAALCTSAYHAEMSRKHNNANILCLGSRVTDQESALQIIEIFLETPFDKYSRHQKRIELIYQRTGR